jgi:hypothetical protein
MVAVTIAGNISREATTPSGNIFADAMRVGDFEVATGALTSTLGRRTVSVGFPTALLLADRADPRAISG